MKTAEAPPSGGGTRSKPRRGARAQHRSPAFSQHVDYPLMDEPLSLQENTDFVIILVRPRGARNVGAIARVMSHFGVSALRLVSPQCDVKSVEARSMAMSAQPLLAEAAHFASLREASRDCGWLVGTSRRLGRKRQPTMRPREDAGALLRRASATRVGLVFGQEDKGLFTEELDLCQEKLRIPALPGGESFNLSQAVLIVLWELFSARQAEVPTRESRRREGRPPERTRTRTARGGRGAGGASAGVHGADRVRPPQRPKSRGAHLSGNARQAGAERTGGAGDAGRAAAGDLEAPPSRKSARAARPGHFVRHRRDGRKTQGSGAAPR